jgi:hypothetical protein
LSEQIPEPVFFSTSSTPRVFRGFVNLDRTCGRELDRSRERQRQIDRIRKRLLSVDVHASIS